MAAQRSPAGGTAPAVWCRLIDEAIGVYPPTTETTGAPGRARHGFVHGLSAEEHCRSAPRIVKEPATAESPATGNGVA